MIKVIARLKGGLGNQLFIYAAGSELAEQIGGSLLLDTRSGFWNDKYKRQYELNKLGIKVRQLNLPSAVLIKLIVKFPVFQELLKNWLFVVNEQNFDAVVRNEFDGTFKILILDGYFQSENYFKNVREKLKSTIMTSLPDMQVFRDLEQQIVSTNSVCIHGRLLRSYASDGTKVSDSDPKIVNATYFIEAINKIKSKVTKPHFFIFSDSPSGFIQILPLKQDEYTLIHHGFHHVPQIDFGLMRKCKHFIIPNSSYSWWAAWLAESDSANIMAPKSEYWDDTNILPERWNEF